MLVLLIIAVICNFNVLTDTFGIIYVYDILIAWWGIAELQVNNDHKVQPWIIYIDLFESMFQLNNVSTLLQLYVISTF